jgi:hypothetical protein
MRTFKIWLCIALLGALAPRASALQIIKGPYLQHVTQTTIVVMWQTDEAADSMVDYGASADYGATASAPGAATIHEVALTGLTPDTPYHYRVRSGEVKSADAVLRSAVRPGTPFRFAVYGDTQSNPDWHRRVAEGILSAQPRLVIHCGDEVGDGNNYEQWQTEFFGPAADLMRATPMYVAIGNHERNSHWFYDFHSYPKPEDYYSFDYGSAHFVIVDTDQPYDDKSPQYQWLQADLASDAAQKSDWLFVAYHKPGYCEGWDHPGYDGEDDVRTYLMPLLEKYGVDMVFNGHAHDYERGFFNGVYYIISGGGAGGLDSYRRDFAHVWTSQYVHHYCTVDLDGPRLTLQAITPDGEVIDRLVVLKRPWPR